MVLTNIHPGDVVQCDKLGHKFYAVVQGKSQGEVEVEPITRGCNYRLLTSRQIIAHYRRSKASNA